MRVFSTEERKCMEELSANKKAGNLLELQISHLLRPKLTGIALKWSIEPKFIKIYFPTACINRFTNEIMKSYYDIVDFIYFIEELEKYNLIKIQNISFSDRRLVESNCLYDNTTYKYERSNDVFKYLDGGTIGLMHINNKEVDNEFVLELEKYANAYVFPLPALDDFITYGFKDFDQRVFDENKETNDKVLRYNRKAILQTEKSLKQTSCSIKISFVSLLLAIIAVVVPHTCSNKDMKNIESAILQNKTITIDSIANHHIDTINVNITNKQQIQPINLKVTVTPNQVTH